MSCVGSPIFPASQSHNAVFLQPLKMKWCLKRSVNEFKRHVLSKKHLMVYTLYKLKQCFIWKHSLERPLVKQFSDTIEVNFVPYCPQGVSEKVSIKKLNSDLLITLIQSF